MADELRIRITAEDAASGKLNELKASLGALSTGAQAAGATGQQALANQIAPAADTAAKSTQNASSQMMALNLGLREVGLGGVANMTRLLAVMGPVAIAVTAIGSAIALVKGSFDAAFADVKTSGLGEFKNILTEIGDLWRGLQYAIANTIGAAIMPYLGPIRDAFHQIVNALTPLLPVLAQIGGWLAGAILWALNGVGKAIVAGIQIWYLFKVAVLNAANSAIMLWYLVRVGAVAAFNALKSGAETAINAIVKGINVWIAGLNKVLAIVSKVTKLKIQPIPTIGTVSLGGAIAMPSAPTLLDVAGLAGAPPVWTDITAAAGPITGGGGGGAGTSAASYAKSAGTGVKATAAGRPDVTGEKSETIKLIDLARVQANEMAELLDLMRNLPTAIRDAIVVYTGGAA